MIGHPIHLQAHDMQIVSKPLELLELKLNIILIQNTLLLKSLWSVSFSFWKDLCSTTLSLKKK